MTSFPSPFTLPNVRRFIAFRALFNARFYYPVFTVLFLDYGLSIEQFALLNTVWAFTIVFAEVPSGALADLIGRKRLLVATGWLMVGEMALLSFVPLGNSSLIFAVFLINRIFSGLAEALASGADEAMAYDTLVADGDPEEWPKVLDMQMRVQNIAYMLTMTLGAIVYSPKSVNSFLDWLGIQAEFSQQVTMRFPVYLTLVLGVLCLWVTLGMRDPVVNVDECAASITTIRGKIRAVSKQTLAAGFWIFHTPMALVIILLGMSFDHVLRMLVTMTSQYYRLIELPEASFGLIGSGVALIGLVVPRLARAMVEHLQPPVNVVCITLLSLLSLWGLTRFVPYLGVIPMILVFISMMLTSFFISSYLNQIADSRQRATVLSFKGLAFNAAYGVIGMLYAGLIVRLRSAVQEDHGHWSITQVADEAFRLSISWFPWYLLAVLMLVGVGCWKTLTKR
jgi:MFS family permease